MVDMTKEVMVEDMAATETEVTEMVDMADMETAVVDMAEDTEAGLWVTAVAVDMTEDTETSRFVHFSNTFDEYIAGRWRIWWWIRRSRRRWR